MLLAKTIIAAKESCGGSFTQTRHSTRHVFDRQLTTADTVTVYSVMELRFKESDLDIHEDSACFTVTIDKQERDGYYIGNGTYAVRYSPKAPATLTYRTSSAIKENDGRENQANGRIKRERQRYNFPKDTYLYIFT